MLDLSTVLASGAGRQGRLDAGRRIRVSAYASCIRNTAMLRCSPAFSGAWKHAAGSGEVRRRDHNHE